MNNLEDFVRNSFDEINSLTLTNNTDEYSSDDYLYLFNRVKIEENQEVHKLLSSIMTSLERLKEIHDDCWSR